MRTLVKAKNAKSQTTINVSQLECVCKNQSKEE